MPELTMYDTSGEPGSGSGGDGGGSGGWDYYGSGYSLGDAVAHASTYTPSYTSDIRENFYFARVGELTNNRNFVDLNWIPTQGRYNGNGDNDAWIRLQVLHEVFGDGRSLNPSEENAQYLLALLDAYEARYPTTDPFGIKPVDQADRLGLIHDLNSFGGAIRDVANNLGYAIGQFGQFLQTGNLYSLGSVPFIGALASVYHVATGIAGGVVAIGGGLVSAGSSLFGGFSSALSHVGSGNFSAALSSFVSGISSAFDALGDALGSAFRALFPVVVDLDGDGVELLSVAQANLQLDIGSGEYRRSGWVGADDGLLAFDVNGNGQVDGYAEFGLTNFSASASTDLQALAEFDSNDDGVFDEQDERFADFLVWRDANGDGICQEGEAISLSAAGIETLQLRLNGDASSRAGNFIANTTSVIFADGVTRDAADVAFASSGASDSARMLAVDVTSHSLGAGLEIITIGSGVASVSVDRAMLEQDTDQLVVAASMTGGLVSITSHISTTFLGGAGDDVFLGSDAASTYLGGGGDNVFMAGVGNDTYVVHEDAEGFDIVLDRGGADSFVLTGNYVFEVVDGDLLIRSASGDYGMKVEDWATQGEADSIILNGQTLDLRGLAGWNTDPSTASLQPPHDSDMPLAA